MINEGYSRAFDHDASDNFGTRPVQPGDRVYAINWSADQPGDMPQFRVIGRIIVDRIVDQPTAESELAYEPWPALSHVLAVPGTLTPTIFDGYVDDPEHLEFIDANGNVVLPTLNDRGFIDKQAFRNVREITEHVAEYFDWVLGLAT